jgi:hypothetical protein
MCNSQPLVKLSQWVVISLTSYFWYALVYTYKPNWSDTSQRTFEPMIASKTPAIDSGATPIGSGGRAPNEMNCEIPALCNKPQNQVWLAYKLDETDSKNKNVSTSSMTTGQHCGPLYANNLSHLGPHRRSLWQTITYCFTCWDTFMLRVYANMARFDWSACMTKLKCPCKETHVTFLQDRYFCHMQDDVWNGHYDILYDARDIIGTMQ